MTPELPVVSIVTIFLDAERFIQEAIDSAFAQTYGAWELLLVDDGSTDRSTEIALQYVHRSGRVRYLEHPGHVNRGMSTSRNLGLKHARGKYIAFLDSDDVWLPGKLEQQVAILDSQPNAGMVYGLSEFWFSWAGREEDCGRDFVHLLGVPSNELIQPPSLLTRFFFAQDAAIPGPTDVLIRRETIERVGGFEDAFRGPYEDEAFYAKVCLSHPVIAVDTVWDRYRQHSGSASAEEERSKQAYAARLFFLKWLRDYLSRQGVDDPEIMQALRRELWRCRHPKLATLRSQWAPLARRTAGRLVPAPIRAWLWPRALGREYVPAPGHVKFGSLGSNPISRDFGYDRGQPIDRYYIENFLDRHRADIHGHVLEVQGDTYTRRFGCDRVTRSDILHVQPGAPKATIVADLADGSDLPSDSFDCIILTQTLQYIYDVRAAIRTVCRILKPGGVVLATMPGISQISRYDMDRWGQHWTFTSLSAQRLFADEFGAAAVRVEAHGNVRTATAGLYGLATQDLRQRDMEMDDPDYQVCVAVRAVKPTTNSDPVALES